ncbi:hypothetical protein HDU76_001865, partial [Blyttiomyces sp. JEL0837]
MLHRSGSETVPLPNGRVRVVMPPPSAPAAGFTTSTNGGLKESGQGQGQGDLKSVGVGKAGSGSGSKEGDDNTGHGHDGGIAGGQ